jgi:TPR repeat protein
MKGWVYVISNKSMPGLFKIGYSMKDPFIRALQFYDTNNPNKFNVEYEALVNQPRLIERRIHEILADKNENKEWFKCKLTDAIEVIESIIGRDCLYVKKYFAEEDKNEYKDGSEECSAQEFCLTIGTEEYVNDLHEKAKNGDKNSQYMLGCIFGDINSKFYDISKSYNWFYNAASNGCIKSICQLCENFKNTTEISKLLDKSVRMFAAMSTDNDDAYAAYCLGVLRSKGYGVPKDIKKSNEWFELAFSRGYMLASMEYAESYKKSKDYNKKILFDIYNNVEKYGDTASQFELANLYEAGEGVLQNFKKANELYQKCANRGDSLSMIKLAHKYELGVSVEKDVKKAFELYSQAANNNLGFAQFKIAKFYLEGTCVGKDTGKAKDLLIMALKNGYDDATEILQNVFFVDPACEISKIDKFNDTFQLALSGSIEGQYELAQLYRDGVGTYQCLKNAYIWFSIASISNCEYSQKNRDDIASKICKEQLFQAQEEAENIYKTIISRSNFADKI